MAKDPAFLFYSSDFLTGTMFMSDNQLGKYIKILCTQHQKGHLSEKDMLKICKRYDKDIFDKFLKDEDGNYYNMRLETEIEKRKAFSKSRSDNRKNKIDYKNICLTYVQHMGNGNGNVNIDINNINIEEYIKEYKIDNIIKLFVEYLEYRKSVKLSNSQTVIKELLDFLKPLTNKEKEKVISAAIKNGWKDFYPVKEKKEVKESGTEYRRI